MILSMTGHGQSQLQADSHVVDCEVRSVNNRFLKVNVSWNECFARFESTLQKMVREKVRRGTLYVNFKVTSDSTDSSLAINARQLNAYRSQVIDLGESIEGDLVTKLLTLPGVVEDRSLQADQIDSIWKSMQQALDGALDGLAQMRSEEGQSMATDLSANVDSIEKDLETISGRAPEVVSNYAKRLEEKINKLLEPHDTVVTGSDIAREVGVFADRSDISEEIVRLRSHIEQFRSNLSSSRSDGRKLEFVTQEMLRETNTIGSKANDSEIAHRVVDIKTAIERIREMVQNIE